MNENKLKKAASAPETFKKPPITWKYIISEFFLNF
jgi:hypothetical protein